jgi:hypothetical protein
VNGTDGDATAIAAGGIHTLALRRLPACSDRIDNDGDGLVDHPTDPGCRSASSARENPQCQDGIDNDRRTGIDFDGGASANGGVPLAEPDPQCTTAWRDRETIRTCGIGFELALVLPALLGLRRRRR